MSRPKGSKNKPKDNGLTGLIYETLPDVLTPREAAKWLRISRNELMRQIHTGEIPEDCYEKSGIRYKLKKNRLAVLKGLRDIDIVA